MSTFIFLSLFILSIMHLIAQNCLYMRKCNMSHDILASLSIDVESRGGT